MSFWRGKKVLLGVTGGIAAYKAPSLVRAFTAAGAHVRVVLTRGGAAFTTPLALQTVSGHPVAQHVLDASEEYEIGHIELARWPDVVLVAPATAHALARARVGLADDLLATVLLATTAPVVFAPAMNTQMWWHPATQEHVAVLRTRPRTSVIEPDAGELACKEVGPGRLPDPPALLAGVEQALRAGRLAEREVLVTAGPTREAFDDARFLSNPSSGQMGYAIAAAAAAEGALVTLVSGPTTLQTPPGVHRVDVTTAEEMNAAVRPLRPDIAICAAAVADWRPESRTDGKASKHQGSWAPTLVRTPDILAGIAARDERPRLVIGFAAEASDLIERARAKLVAKRLDGIVANSIRGGGAFGASDNEVWLVTKQGEVALARAPKREVADAIVDWISSLESERPL